MRKILWLAAALAAFIALPALAGAAQGLPQEALLISQAFASEVGDKKAVDEQYQQDAERELLEAIGAGTFDRPQYVIFVDRNPEIQTGSLVYVDPSSRNVVLLGSFPVSTGNPSRKGHFETPKGIFQNSPENLGYRALGTKNSKGWRGLGRKGARVWDFGWQQTLLPNGEPREIRFLMHATDPDNGEPRLGKVDSKGCVRIPGSVNAFLDRWGILDALYEGGSRRVQAVLLPGHIPTEFAGAYLVVGDSRD